ncbi:hypothetical protein DFP72DRAFT_212957 [Ephemerocybe angulata]|uniref:Uncharacterized protein n=1 Tax=Ephemerocybe angulata TaxID=980116 RepID=A0A8H6MAK7_9AGAR|nr:hypothetical protein DFP72DRAFT_212957 [Tulosesus angulatus]
MRRAVANAFAMGLRMPKTRARTCATRSSLATVTAVLNDGLRSGFCLQHHGNTSQTQPVPTSTTLATARVHNAGCNHTLDAHALSPFTALAKRLQAVPTPTPTHRATSRHLSRPPKCRGQRQQRRTRARRAEPVFRYYCDRAWRGWCWKVVLCQKGMLYSVTTPGSAITAAQVNTRRRRRRH